jgi:K+-transporting ATPase ATPase C chain
MHIQTSTRQLIRPAIMALVLFTLLTGVLYPLLVTAIAQVAFPSQANGSLIASSDGKIVGSRLIGQQFDQPQYFWGRLSATGPVAYNASASSGSNLGPLNPALIGPDGSVQARIDALAAADAELGIEHVEPIPVDLVTASGSGLDPHISPAAAQYQAARVAAARKMALEDVEALIAQFTEGRTLGFLGEPRVNVLLLNLALDEGSQ